MLEDEYAQDNLDVLWNLGPTPPDAPHVPWGDSPEIQAIAVQIRRRYFEQCRAADEAFAAQHPGRLFERLCDRPGIKRLLEEIPDVSLDDG